MSELSDMLKAFVRAYSGMNPDEGRDVLAELRRRVADMECENFELRRRNAELADENARLRRELAARKRLERRGPAVFVLEDDGEETGPVCPQCHNGDGIVVLLERATGGARCSRCGTRYAGVDAPEYGRCPRIG